MDDVKNVQSIGRKSVNDLSAEDVVKTEVFARKYYKEIGEKSPFFRAWFGDWRANDTTPVHIVTERGAVRGVTKNADTGWDIQISGKVFNETKAHNQNYNVKARPYLEYINSIVENAILLDSHTISSEKAKSANSAMMHSLYAISDMGNGKEIIKLYVEELNDVNSDGTIKRAYQLQNIENQQLNDRVQDKSLAPSASTADTYTVSQLFRFVKGLDKNFKPKESSKVVNADGTPKVVYHGTNAQFNVFESGHKRTSGYLSFGDGFYFSPTKAMAENYIDGENGAVIEAYVSVKKPYILFGTQFEKSDFHEIGKQLKSVEQVTRENVTLCLKKLGYDGIIAKTYNGKDNPIRTIVVFESNQIKLATDNIGTFDGSTPDIRFALDDVVDGNQFET